MARSAFAQVAQLNQEALLGVAHILIISWLDYSNVLYKDLRLRSIQNLRIAPEYTGAVIYEHTLVCPCNITAL